MKSDQLQDLINASKTACEDLMFALEDCATVTEHERGRLVVKLNDIVTNLRQIQNLFWGNNPKQVFSGRPLESTQYLYWRALGHDLGSAHGLGLFPISDHDIHKMLCYEDDKRYCYINPAPQSTCVTVVDKETGALSVNPEIGRYPEELQLKHLRPEQLDFFTEYMPEVLRRFQVD